jgi:alpha-1,2-mannosyltransferase
MIEKSALSLWARWQSGLLDLNHTRIHNLASVLQIAKFAPRPPQNEANFATRTLGRVRLAVAQLVPARLHRLAAVAPQLSRYALVSAAALACDFAVFLALTRVAVWPAVAGVLGYAVGTVLHYLLSVRFVFDARATDKAHTRLFSEFAVTGVGGMAATALVIWAATDLTGLSALPAKVLAAGVSFILVFALRRSVVFARGGVSGGEAGGELPSRVRREWGGLARKLALPAPGPDFYIRFTVAGFALFASAEVAYFLFSPAPSFHLPSVDGFGGTAIGRDFLNAWMGGRSALAEGPAAWFDPAVYNDVLRSIVGITERYYWSYPPHVLLFVWPLGLMPYFPAFVLWTLGGFALFLYAALHGGIERRHLLFLAVAPAVALNVFIGQNGFFTAALLIGGLVNLDRRPVLSGVLFGVLTIKPQLGLLLPVMLAASGRWRTMAAAAATIAALVVATSWLYGADIWTAYLDKVVPVQRHLQEHGGGLLLLQVSSAFFAGRLLGLPIAMDWALQAVVSAAALAAVVWTFWRRRDLVLSSALLVTCAFLFTPYSMNYDMVVLAWAATLLRRRAMNEPVDHYLVVAVWTLPVTMMLAGAIHIPLAFLVLSGFAARLVWLLARERAIGPVSARSASIVIPAQAGIHAN